MLLYAIGLNKSITAGVEECRVVKKDISDIEFEGINKLRIFLWANRMRNDFQTLTITIINGLWCLTMFSSSQNSEVAGILSIVYSE